MLFAEVSTNDPTSRRCFAYQESHEKNPNVSCAAVYFPDLQTYLQRTGDPKKGIREEWGRSCAVMHPGWEYVFWDLESATGVVEKVCEPSESARMSLLGSQAGSVCTGACRGMPSAAELVGN